MACGIRFVFSIFTGLYTQTFRNRVMKCLLLFPVLVADVSGHVPGKPLQWPYLAHHRYVVHVYNIYFLVMLCNLQSVVIL